MEEFIIYILSALGLSTDAAATLAGNVTPMQAIFIGLGFLLISAIRYEAKNIAMQHAVTTARVVSSEVNRIVNQPNPPTVTEVKKTTVDIEKAVEAFRKALEGKASESSTASTSA